MNNVWKWIFGLLIALVVVTFFASLGFGWRMYSLGYPSLWAGRGWHLMPGWHTWPYAGLGWRGFLPLGGFFLGGLVKLLLLAALLYGAYWLGQRNARLSSDPGPAAPIPNAPSAPAAPPAPSQESPSSSEG